MFFKWILFYLSINLYVCYLNAYYNRDKKYEIKKQFVDIYTNHPYTDEVVDSYKNSDFYQYPKNKYTVHRSNGINNSNRRYSIDYPDKYQYPASIRAKFKDPNDILYSDFGVFDADLKSNRRNDTKSNYNFVFDDKKNLVYIQTADNNVGIKNANNIDNDRNYFNDDNDSKANFVYIQSQKHIDTPKIGLRFSQPRPIFQTVKKRPENFDEPFNSYTTIKPVKKDQKRMDLAGNKTHLNNLLRRFMIKLHRTKKNQNINNVDENTSSDVDDDSVITDGERVVPQESFIPESEKSKFLELPFKNLKNKTLNIANKILSLFTIIQFPNSRCVANSATSAYEGTCFHASECAEMNGTAMGNCARGYGVCCVFRDTCGGSSDHNCTYFESPGYPDYYPSDPSILPPNFNMTTTPSPGLTPDPRIHLNRYSSRFERQLDIPTSLACTFRVYKTTPGVQQMRIDFIDLELTSPTDGTCVDERLVISGFNVNNIPVICGYNTGQHVYIDVAGLVGPLQIQVLANSAQRKRFKLRICQYESSCTGSIGCLQYFTGVSGVISSFNYDKAAVYSRSDPEYFNNLNYAICIRREPGYCSITYTNVEGGVEYPFQLINFEGDTMTVPEGEAGVEIFNCPDDYIIINGMRLCGYKLNDGSTIPDFTMNAPVTDTSGGPIVIPVRTNGMNVGRGFKLFYMQNRCTT